MYKIFIDKSKENALINLIYKFIISRQKNKFKCKLMYYSTQKFEYSQLGNFSTNDAEIKTKFENWYNSFNESQDGEFRREWIEILSINTCLYCNLSFTNNNNKTEVSIDHFYSKNEYPLLACNIFNFIPSCAVCNSQYKHNKEFSTEYYPYEFESESKHLEDNITIFQKINSYNDIEAVTLKKRENLDLGISTKYENDSLNQVLELENRYNHPAIKNEAIELLMKLEAVNNESRIWAMTSMFSSIGLTATEAKQVFMGTSIEDRSDYLKRPLSKLRSDLIKQHAPWLLDN